MRRLHLWPRSPASPCPPVQCPGCSAGSAEEFPRRRHNVAFAGGLGLAKSRGGMHLPFFSGGRSTE